MKHAALVDHLVKLNGRHVIDLGLDRMFALMNALGNPQNALPTIHVAGTNGKGSVATKIASALHAQGYRVGLYTSPHISTFRERIVVYGEDDDEKLLSRLVLPRSNIISKHAVELLLPQVIHCAAAEKASYFEIVTAFAFKVFQHLKCDISVIEVGLGGRLDATNVIEKPQLAVVTSIGLDHVRFLGNTIDKIAREKAGIIKKDCPVVIGPCVPLETVLEAAEESQAKYVVQVSTSDDDDDDGGRTGGFERVNQRIAEKCLEVLTTETPFKVSEQAVAIGLQKRPACRAEKFEVNSSVTALLDVGHNPSAIEKLLVEVRNCMTEHIEEIEFICGFSRDKDYKGCFELIKSFDFGGGQVRSKGISFSKAVHYRAEDPERLLECFGNQSEFQTRVYPSIATAVQAQCHSSAGHRIVVVFGSLFIMHEARVQLNCDLLADLEVSHDEQEYFTLNE
eukprot:TRINITY_DN5936_c0_g2_i1.p1 TRINITY_DN5936_c0_g2~~TRINITY_DN5936_c0_g2_i1.p1  ORF type:complete len:452 (+),score=137.99 TRINITY_DN5936_c0_g2_i1:32-1387(+)